MQRFSELLQKYQTQFKVDHFPARPQSLYDPNRYFLSLGGKRIRPVLCLMANELFDQIHEDAYTVGNAIELFHNFSLIHDDIMDNAPLRRGQTTVHEKYGLSTAILAGDVMLIKTYEYLSKVQVKYLPQLLHLFNQTATEICEGQQLDMDFEKMPKVGLEEYIQMITLKTSVLVAASLKFGAIIGGAGEGNQNLLYQFGRDLGIAFQIQDDYLDAFGDPTKVGKKVGGDILENKKTFLLIRALETATGSTAKELEELLQTNPTDKVERVLKIYDTTGVKVWAEELKKKYFESALKHLDNVAVVQVRKEPLEELANLLLQREY